MKRGGVQMGRSAEIFVWLPTGFAPEEFLEPKLVDAARYLMGLVVRKTAIHDVDTYEYVRLHSLVLRRVVGRGVAKIWKAFKARDLINTSPHIAGERCRGYRLAKCLRGQQSKPHLLTDPGLLKRIRRELARMEDEREATWLPIHHGLRDMQRHLSILPEAWNAIGTLKPEAWLGQSFLVSHLERRRPSFSVPSTGRVFNGLTGLSRALRPYVRLCGDPIVGLDLRNAQPALLAALASPAESIGLPTYKSEFLGDLVRCPGRYSLSLRGPAAGPRDFSGEYSRFARRLSRLVFEPSGDFWRFRDLVLDGDLWEELIRLCHAHGIPLPGDEERDEVKLLTLRDVIAKKGIYPSAFEDMFQREFPSVYRFIRWANNDHRATLIRVLQRFESWLVIENVAPRLVERRPIITLHDAIYSREQDRGLVYEAFQDTFEDLDLKLRLKDEVHHPHVEQSCLETAA